MTNGEDMLNIQTIDSISSIYAVIYPYYKQYSLVLLCKGESCSYILM